jgi:hypothetical protein
VPVCDVVDQGEVEDHLDQISTAETAQ